MSETEKTRDFSEVVRRKLAANPELATAVEYERGIAELETELASLRERLKAAERENDAGREVLRQAWREFNAIRARDGAPAGVCHEYWDEMTESLNALVGDEDAKPWMTKATRELIRPYENRNADLSSRLVDAELALSASESKLAAAERENARLREGIKRVACDWDRKSSDVYGLVAGEDGKAIRAVVDGFSALLAQPEEVKDGT